MAMAVQVQRGYAANMNRVTHDVLYGYHTGSPIYAIVSRWLRRTATEDTTFQPVKPATFDVAICGAATDAVPLQPSGVHQEARRHGFQQPL